MGEQRNNDGYKISEIQRMKAMYEGGGLSRRDFMQGLLAVGLTATTAGAILTGSRDVAAQTPKRGGRIRYANSGHGRLTLSIRSCSPKASRTPADACT